MTPSDKCATTHSKKKGAQGFTLVELMVVVAIVSILAVIAIPAYQDYVVRSKVSEGMVFMAEAKTSVSEYFYMNKALPSGNEQAGLPDPGDYDSAAWAEAGFPDGPETYADLLEGGAFIKDNLGKPMGLGLSPEIDSNMAMRAIMYSFGASVQDEGGNVVINSKQTMEAVNFVRTLFKEAMCPAYLDP